jgi:hypothetical protein
MTVERELTEEEALAYFEAEVKRLLELGELSPLATVQMQAYEIAIKAIKERAKYDALLRSKDDFGI